MSLSPSFLLCKKNFFYFFFWNLKLQRIFHKKQEKVWKNFVLVVKNFLFKICFFSRQFITAVFFGGEQFSPKVKPFSNRPVSTQHCFQKPGGVIRRLFWAIQPAKWGNRFFPKILARASHSFARWANIGGL